MQTWELSSQSGRRVKDNRHWTMEITTSFIVVPLVDWFSLLQYCSAINRVCWHLKVQTRQFAISYITYACGHNEGAPTDKRWLVLPHLVCPKWPLSLVAPLPHAHDPSDMHLPKESLLTSYGTVKSCHIKNGYSAPFTCASGHPALYFCSNLW